MKGGDCKRFTFRFSGYIHVDITTKRQHVSCQETYRFQLQGLRMTQASSQQRQSKSQE